ncbi:YqjF family protein [Haladaptatus sp. NG-SE-30]
MRALQFTWRDCLFVHWPLDPDALRIAVPDSLAIDTRDGQAWVSVLASTVENARPPGLPAQLGMTFPQVNFRTYVRLGQTRGVYFLSLDTTSRLATRIARTLYRLPYHHANIVTESNDTRHVRSQRLQTDAPPAEFEVTYRPEGSATTPEPGSLTHFLAERYRLFVPRTEMLTTRVEHDPWYLHDVEGDVSADSLFEAVGFPAPEANQEPRIRYCPRMDFRVHAPKRLDR